MPEFVAPQFVRVRTGLLEPKHLKKLGGGSPLVLYLWLQERVHFTGEHAGEWLPDDPYRHEEAARELDEPISSVRRWFYQLVKHGYVVAVRERYGLRLTITKYAPPASRVSVNEHSPINKGLSADGQSGPSRLPTDEHPAPSRVSVNGQSGAHPECPSADTLSGPECSFTDSPNATSEHSGWAALKNARAIPTENYRDPLSATQKEGTRARALTPMQHVVNAYLTGLDRDPFKAPDFGRFTTVGQEMVELGRDPDDVLAYTRYLRSEPWRKARGKRPTLEEVRDGIPGWIEMGRPAVFVALERAAAAARKPDAANTYWEALELEAQLRGTNSSSGSGTGRDARERLGVRPGVRPVHGLLPAEPADAAGDRADQAGLAGSPLPQFVGRRPAV